MTRTLAGLFVAGIALAPLGAQAPAGEKKPADIVTLRGCVSGSLLKSVQPDLASGSLPISDRYRMTGSKTIKATIKTANKSLVDVTGRVNPGPQAVTKSTSMGKTGIGIGIAPNPNAVDETAPYTPTIDVEKIEVVAADCDKP
jgi:hypothetical protein